MSHMLFIQRLFFRAVMASLFLISEPGRAEALSLAQRLGYTASDKLLYLELKDESKDVKGFWMDIVKNLKPGVTEVYIHPAVVSDELKSITGTWQTRSLEYEVFTRDSAMRQLIQDEGVKTISFRPLRKLQRESVRAPGSP